MRYVISILIIIYLLPTVAPAIDPPDPDILLRFFRERLTPDSIWIAHSRCEVVSSGDTTIGEGIDTLGLDNLHCDYAEELSPFAPSLDLISFPVQLAQTEFDSIRINKTRTRVKGIMCWKFRIYLGDETIACYLSGEGFFRTMKMERKGRGKSKSDDIWEFVEIQRGKDLPCKITRFVEFEWGGEKMEIRATRELKDFRVAEEHESP